MKQALFLLLLVGLIGCKSERTVPEEYLQKAPMAQVMADLMEMQERLKIENLPKDSAHKVMVAVYRPMVFKKRGITPALFDSSYVFYCKDSELFNDMMNQAVDTLSVRVELEHTFQP